MISAGPAGWRIFLFNIFEHAPVLTRDFTWPDHLMKGFVKLFTGCATSITHMHFDYRPSHILHRKFFGRKKVLLFPFKKQHELYSKPFEVLSIADFSPYDVAGKTREYDDFPAVRLARGYELILEHGNTLFMPAGFWQHMEYLDSGFAISLRALQLSGTGKLHGACNLFGVRNIDTLMKKTMTNSWYEWKKKKIYELAV